MDWNARDWKSFEGCVREYFSEFWGKELKERSVLVGGSVPWKFDLVSEDGSIVGDCKWLKNIPAPAAKWQAIAECIWLLQKVRAARTFMVFGQDVEVAARYLKRVGPLTAPLEFYFLDVDGHRVIPMGS